MSLRDWRSLADELSLRAAWAEIKEQSRGGKLALGGTFLFMTPGRRLLYALFFGGSGLLLGAFSAIAGQHGVPDRLLLLFLVLFVVLESAFSVLLAADLRKKCSLEADQQAAREIQRCFLPDELPTLAGIEMAGRCQTFSDVGGDYYDAFLLDDGSLFLVVADVAGKGTPAALVMANMQAILRTSDSMPLPSLALKLHHHLLHYTGTLRYATAFMARIPPGRRLLEYVNAGHEPPLLCSEGKVTRLTTGGLPLGLLDLPAGYEAGQVDLPERFTLALFTDGLADWETVSGANVGALLPELLSAGEAKAAATLLEEAFAAGSSEHPMFDDATLLVLKSG